MKNLICFGFLMLVLTASAAAQKMTTPVKASADYKEIVNAVKTYDSEQRDEFSEATYMVNTIRVQGAWAYTSVEPKLQGDGESLNYGVGHVFLQKGAGGWKVVFSTHNDKEEVGIDGLQRLKKNKTFPKQLATFAESQLAG